jgi:hypothetical protein
LILNGKVIYYVEYISGTTIDLGFSRKFLYLDDEEYLFFTYNESGEIDSIGGTVYPFSEYNQSLEPGELDTYFPNLLIEHPYYSNADFLPQ